MTIATYLTLSRLIISPLFLLVYAYHGDIGISSEALPWVLLGLLTLSELSDAFDGYFARKYDEVTDLGKILDPMADSLVRLTVFLSFTGGVVHLPVLPVFILIYRDSVVSTLRTICALRGFALAARPSGKIKAVIQAIAAFIIIILMIPHSWGSLSTETLRFISVITVSIAAVYTIFSGIDYIYANREYILNLLVKKKHQS